MKHRPSLGIGASDHKLLEHGHKMSVHSECKKLSFQDVEDDYREGTDE